jgi:autotransporter-associated beta strand protein
VGTVASGPIGAGALLIAPEIASASSSGTVLAFGGARTIANPLQYPSATNNQTLIVGGTNALTFTGPYTLNGNDGSSTFTNRILQVNNAALTTISGEISGTGFGLIKTGTGILDITGAESYTGNTTISNGTLRVSGSLNAASTVIVATNGTLGGTGTVNGPVTVLAAGSIAPGNSIGALTINNNLTLSGNLDIEVNRSGLASDNVSVSGILTNSGTGRVVVTNLGAALVPGDTFALFNKALANGNAMTILGGQVVWTNKLAINGTISVAAPVATTPTNISYSLSGNSLTLSWPANYLTWSLQSNSVSLVSTNWFIVPNSSAATQFVITINPARTNVTPSVTG